ncbi:MAG: hypothetical protein AB7I30_11260 [Isosphaeraceae bacterium]
MLAPTSMRPALGAWRPAVVQVRYLPPRGGDFNASPSTLAPQEVALDDQVSFAYSTVRDGQRIAASRPVRDVGMEYAKLSVSHDARKVGAAYVSAALRGDGNDLQRLGDTPLVRKVGNQFHQLSESSAVQRLGDAFERFGKSVAREFNRLFGL